MVNYLVTNPEMNKWWIIPLVLIIWDLIWRGKALWRASKDNQKWWFIALLLVNSIGILPLIYLAFFAKKGKNKK